jgi:hypothetical protein
VLGCSQSGFHCGQDLGAVIFKINGVDDRFYKAVFTDNKGLPVWVLTCQSIAFSDALFCVHEKSGGQLEFLAKGDMSGGGIIADSKDFYVSVIEACLSVTQTAKLSGSAGGVVFGVEDQGDCRLAVEVG